MNKKNSVIPFCICKSFSTKIISMLKRMSCLNQTNFYRLFTQVQIQDKMTCSELRCIRQYSGSNGLFYWTLVSFRGNLVPIKGTSQRDYKLVPSRVHNCQSPMYTAVMFIYYSVACKRIYKGAFMLRTGSKIPSPLTPSYFP